MQDAPACPACVSLFCTSPLLQVTKVELLLNYEGSVDYPLAIGSIDNFLLELAVHPATLQVRWGVAGFQG